MDDLIVGLHATFEDARQDALDLTFDDVREAAAAVGYLADSSPICVEVLTISNGKPIGATQIASVAEAWAEGDVRVEDAQIS